MLEKVRLGKTGFEVARVAMGCIPIQRLSKDDAVKLLRRAHDGGVNFYDTANMYTNSEEKIGAAFPGAMRQQVIIASKTMSDTYDQAMNHIDTSLRRLGTDYVDLFQWHNPEKLDTFLFDRGPYQAMQDARKAGKIRAIGISQHHYDRAQLAIESGAFDTLQYPLSLLSSPQEIDMTFKCQERGMGVIAMKAMCGGMLPDGRLPFIFLNQYRHIVPIWGLEKESELDQFIRLAAEAEPFDESMRTEIEKLRAELGNNYCRGCGYCLPCPVNIPIPILMRIDCFIKRNPAGSQFNPARLEEVSRIDNCINCGACVSRCPYDLDVPNQLKRQRDSFRQMYTEYQKQG